MNLLALPLMFGVFGRAGRAAMQALLVPAVALGMVTGGQALAQSVLYRIDGPGTEARLGEDLCALGDVDGDSTTDFVVGARFYAGDQGRVVAYSGSSGAILWTRDGQSTGDLYGHRVAYVGDLDGDGWPDVAVSGPQFNSKGTGYVEILSGTSGTPISGYVFTGNAAGDRYGAGLAGGRDIDLDGVPDIVIGASQWVSQSSKQNGDGYVQVRSGATGAVIRILPGVPDANFGGDVGMIGDVDGDAVPDLLVAASERLSNSFRAGRVFLYSGATGSTVHTLDGKGRGAFGEAVASVNDLNGDGIDDILVAERGWAQTVPVAWAFCGSSGNEIWSNEAGYADGDYMVDIGAFEDVDNDSVPDVLVGCPGTPTPKVGFVEILSGATGKVIPGKHISYGNAGDRFGSRVVPVGDLDVDGVPDLAVGAVTNDAGGPNAGRIYALSSSCLSGVRYCVAKVNSAGCTPTISGIGMPTGTGHDDYHVVATQVMGQTSGVLLWGLSRSHGISGPLPAAQLSPFGGRYCIAKPQVFGVAASGGTAGACDGTLDFHLTQQFFQRQGLTPGTVVYVQAWYKDSGHPDGSGVGHTEGLEFTVCP